MRGGEKSVELRARLRSLGQELRAAFAALVRERETLPGLFAVVEVGPYAALVPCDQIQEIVQLVATDPSPGAEGVLGTFQYHGVRVVALDLGRLFGLEREASLDAHVLVMQAARPYALVVDAVRSLEESPQAVEWNDEKASTQRWAVGACRVRNKVLALLDLEALARRAGQVEL